MKNLLVLILLLSLVISCNKSNDIKEIDTQINNKSDNLSKNANGVHKLIPVEEQIKIREKSKAIAEAEKRDKILAEAEEKAKADAKLKAEQKAKEEWKQDNSPYASLPRMVMLTYQLPDSIKQISMGGEYNEFDLNIFFSAMGEGVLAKFQYEDEVQKWLDLIRGAYMPTSVEVLNNLFLCSIYF